MNSMPASQMTQSLFRMKRRIVHHDSHVFWNTLEECFAKPFDEKMTRPVLRVTPRRHHISADFRGHHVRSLEFSSTFNVLHFCATQGSTMLANQALVHAALIHIDSFLFGDLGHIFHEFGSFFLGFFGVSERLFLRVIFIFFRA